MSETQSYKTVQELARSEQRKNAFACVASVAMIAFPVAAWAFGWVMPV